MGGLMFVSGAAVVLVGSIWSDGSRQWLEHHLLGPVVMLTIGLALIFVVVGDGKRAATKS